MAFPLLAPLASARSTLTDRRFAAALALGVGLWAMPAAAHIELLVPAARYSPDSQKSPPCGHPDNPPGAGAVATYQAGETITIEFDEFIDHAGHFRVALDPTGTDDFTSPTGFEDFYNSPQVILDDIPDMGGGVYSIDVTLPDTPCEACTLQLIQVMNDGSWGPGDSDLYFQCADIVIEGAGGGTAGGTGGDETGGGGDTGGAGSTGGAGGTSPGGDVGSGGPVGSEGSSTGSNGSEGTAGETGTGGSGDSDDGEGGCSCRANGGSPAAAAPWLLVALLAVRRRRR